MEVGGGYLVRGAAAASMRTVRQVAPPSWLLLIWFAFVSHGSEVRYILCARFDEKVQ